MSSPGVESPTSKKQGLKQRLLRLFSRSEGNLKEKPRSRSEGDKSPTRDKRLEKKVRSSWSEKKGRKDRNEAQEGAQSLPRPRHPRSEDSVIRRSSRDAKARSFSYSDLEVPSSNLLQRFGSLTWRKKRSSGQEYNDSTPNTSSTSRSHWSMGRLDRPAVGSDLDLKNRRPASCIVESPCSEYISEGSDQCSKRQHGGQKALKGSTSFDYLTNDEYDYSPSYPASKAKNIQVQLPLTFLHKLESEEEDSLPCWAESILKDYLTPENSTPDSQLYPLLDETNSLEVSGEDEKHLHYRSPIHHLMSSKDKVLEPTSEEGIALKADKGLTSMQQNSKCSKTHKQKSKCQSQSSLNSTGQVKLQNGKSKNQIHLYTSMLSEDMTQKGSTETVSCQRISLDGEHNNTYEIEGIKQLHSSPKRVKQKETTKYNMSLNRNSLQREIQESIQTQGQPVQDTFKDKEHTVTKQIHSDKRKQAVTLNLSELHASMQENIKGLTSPSTPKIKYQVIITMTKEEKEKKQPSALAQESVKGDELVGQDLKLSPSSESQACSYHGAGVREVIAQSLSETSGQPGKNTAQKEEISKKRRVAESCEGEQLERYLNLKVDEDCPLTNSGSEQVAEYCRLDSSNMDKHDKKRKDFSNFPKRAQASIIPERQKSFDTSKWSVKKDNQQNQIMNISNSHVIPQAYVGHVKNLQKVFEDISSKDMVSHQVETVKSQHGSHREKDRVSDQEMSIAGLHSPVFSQIYNPLKKDHIEKKSEHGTISVIDSSGKLHTCIRTENFLDTSKDVEKNNDRFSKESAETQLNDSGQTDSETFKRRLKPTLQDLQLTSRAPTPPPQKTMNDISISAGSPKGWKNESSAVRPTKHFFGQSSANQRDASPMRSNSSNVFFTGSFSNSNMDSEMQQKDAQTDQNRVIHSFGEVTKSHNVGKSQEDQRTELSTTHARNLRYDESPAVSEKEKLDKRRTKRGLALLKKKIQAEYEAHEDSGQTVERRSKLADSQLEQEVKTEPHTMHLGKQDELPEKPITIINQPSKFSNDMLPEKNQRSRSPHYKSDVHIFQKPEKRELGGSHDSNHSLRSDNFVSHITKGIVDDSTSKISAGTDEKSKTNKVVQGKYPALTVKNIDLDAGQLNQSSKKTEIKVSKMPPNKKQDLKYTVAKNVEIKHPHKVVIQIGPLSTAHEEKAPDLNAGQPNRGNKKTEINVSEISSINQQVPKKGLSPIHQNVEMKHTHKDVSQKSTTAYEPKTQDVGAGQLNQENKKTKIRDSEKSPSNQEDLKYRVSVKRLSPIQQNGEMKYKNELVSKKSIFPTEYEDKSPDLINKTMRGYSEDEDKNIWEIKQKTNMDTKIDLSMGQNINHELKEKRSPRIKKDSSMVNDKNVENVSDTYLKSAINENFKRSIDQPAADLTNVHSKKNKNTDISKQAVPDVATRASALDLNDQLVSNVKNIEDLRVSVTGAAERKKNSSDLFNKSPMCKPSNGITKNQCENIKTQTVDKKDSREEIVVLVPSSKHSYDSEGETDMVASKRHDPLHFTDLLVESHTEEPSSHIKSPTKVIIIKSIDINDISGEAFTGLTDSDTNKQMDYANEEPTNMAIDAQDTCDQKINVHNLISGETMGQSLEPKMNLDENNVISVEEPQENPTDFVIQDSNIKIVVENAIEIEDRGVEKNVTDIKKQHKHETTALVYPAAEFNDQPQEYLDERRQDSSPTFFGEKEKSNIEYTTDANVKEVIDIENIRKNLENCVEHTESADESVLQKLGWVEEDQSSGHQFVQVDGLMPSASIAGLQEVTGNKACDQGPNARMKQQSLGQTEVVSLKKPGDIAEIVYTSAKTEKDNGGSALNWSTGESEKNVKKSKDLMHLEFTNERKKENGQENEDKVDVTNDGRNQSQDAISIFSANDLFEELSEEKAQTTIEARDENQHKGIIYDKENGLHTALETETLATDKTMHEVDQTNNQVLPPKDGIATLREHSQNMANTIIDKQVGNDISVSPKEYLAGNVDEKPLPELKTIVHQEHVSGHHAKTSNSIAPVISPESLDVQVPCLRDTVTTSDIISVTSQDVKGQSNLPLPELKTIDHQENVFEHHTVTSNSIALVTTSESLDVQTPYLRDKVTTINNTIATLPDFEEQSTLPLPKLKTIGFQEKVHEHSARTFNPIKPSSVSSEPLDAQNSFLRHTETKSDTISIHSLTIEGQSNLPLPILKTIDVQENVQESCKETTDSTTPMMSSESSDIQMPYLIDTKTTIDSICVDTRSISGTSVQGPFQEECKTVNLNDNPQMCKDVPQVLKGEMNAIENYAASHLEEDDSPENMESWVNRLKQLETPEFLKYQKPRRQPHSTPQFIYTTLPPIKEDQVLPKCDHPDFDCQFKEKEETPKANDIPSEIDSVFETKATEQSDKSEEAPKYSWEKSADKVIIRSSPLELMRKHSGEDSSRSENYKALITQSLSQRQSTIIGALLISDRLDRKSESSEGKSFSRLESSYLLSSYIKPKKDSQPEPAEQTVSQNMSPTNSTNSQTASDSLSSASGSSTVSDSLTNALGASIVSDSLTNALGASTASDSLTSASGASTVNDSLTNASGASTASDSLTSASGASTASDSLTSASGARIASDSLTSSSGACKASDSLTSALGTRTASDSVTSASGTSTASDTFICASGTSTVSDSLTSALGSSAASDLLTSAPGTSTASDLLTSASRASTASNSLNSSSGAACDSLTSASGKSTASDLLTSSSRASTATVSLTSAYGENTTNDFLASALGANIASVPLFNESRANTASVPLIGASEENTYSDSLTNRSVANTASDSSNTTVANRASDSLTSASGSKTTRDSLTSGPGANEATDILINALGANGARDTIESASEANRATDSLINTSGANRASSILTSTSGAQHPEDKECSSQLQSDNVHASYSTEVPSKLEPPVAPPCKVFPDVWRHPEKMHGKLNPRPGKIILFSEPGFKGDRHEIYSDVGNMTDWDLQGTVSISIVRGGWLLYEKPQFRGKRVMLTEGDTDLPCPWDVKEEKKLPVNAMKSKFWIGSLRHVVRDFQVPRISLFMEENGEGNKVTIFGATPDSRAHGYPTKTESIIVYSGIWLLYSKPFFEGDPYILEPGGYPNRKAWNGHESHLCSLQPAQIGGPTVEKPNEPKIQLFKYAGFEGPAWEVCKDLNSLQREVNSEGERLLTVESIRVVGGCWVGYEKEGFHGHQYLLEEGKYKDVSSWGGCSAELGSLRHIRTNFSEPEIVLYEKPGCSEGPCLRLNESLSDIELAKFGTKTESIYVLNGVWVAYENVDFSGEQYILEKGIYHSYQDWGGKDNQICSIQPILQVGGRSLRYSPKLQLFSEPYFRGDYMTFVKDRSSIPESFSLQSCRIEGGSWCFYEGKDCRGEQYILSEGDYPTRTAMGCQGFSTIRSLKKIPLYFSIPSISLHGLEKFEGKELNFIGEVRSLQGEGYNNLVLSIRVKSGLWVVYEHSDFRGRQWLLERAKIPNWLLYSGLQKIGSLCPVRQRRVYFRLRNRVLGLFLCVPEASEDMKAARVQLSNPQEGSSDLWFYEEGRIKNQFAPQMSLQVIGTANQGTKVVLWSEERKPVQTWALDESGCIVSFLFKGMCLDIKGGQSYDSNQVVLWEVSEDRLTQRWDLEVY